MKEDMPNIVSKKSDKKVIVSKVNNNNKQDTLPDNLKQLKALLDQEETNQRFETVKNCKSKDHCSKILNSFFTVRQMKIATIAKINMGISKDFEKLCLECQNSVFGNYKTEVQNSEEPLEIFTLRVRESDANDEYQTATDHLMKITNISNYSQQEIDEYIKFYKGCKERHDEAQRLLTEKINELEAVKRGYQL